MSPTALGDVCILYLKNLVEKVEHKTIDMKNFHKTAIYSLKIGKCKPQNTCSSTL